MNRQQALFDERVTLNKMEGYRSQLDDESSGDQTSGTYAEMVEEVEKVSEMLLQTQSKLWESQNEVKSYNSKAHVLQSTLEEKEDHIEKLKRQNDHLREDAEASGDEIVRLNQEISDRDEGRARPALEKRLRKAIEFLNRDLETARDKNVKNQEEIQEQQSTILEHKKSNERLQQSSDENGNQAESSSSELSTCRRQLREASEGNAYMIEEVAKLRDELQNTKKIAEQKDVIIRQEVEANVKEKIKLEVRKTVTKQVSEKVTRDVTSRMKAEREKELTALREQIKRIVKENALLQSQIGTAEKKAAEATDLEQAVHELQYEISRYEFLLDESQSNHELNLSKVDTNFRMKLQLAKEEAAKEKWAHTTEIRKQMTKEREREVDNFTQRVEALSKQTDRLLDRAEKEKESYATHVRKRVSEEKQREILALTEKLESRTKESEQLLRDTNKDKEAYAEQLRRRLQEEHKRQANKFSHQIEIVSGEKLALQKKVDAFEEELASTWHEHGNHLDQLKLSQTDIKSLEDDVFKLKRKNQNLVTLISRYKTDSEETSKDLKHSKHLFREALLKSEEQCFKLKAKLKKYEPMISKSKEYYSKTLQSLEEAKRALVERVNLYEKENTRLVKQNENLRSSLEGNESDLFADIENENSYLKEKIESLETILERSTAVGSIPTDDAPQKVSSENTQLKASIQDMETLLQQFKEAMAHSKADSLLDLANLRGQLEDTNHLLDQYRAHKTDATKELERAKERTVDALTMAPSEDDTVQLNHEIQTIERLLEMYNLGGMDHISQVDVTMGRTKSDDGQLPKIERLQADVRHLTSLLENYYKHDHDSNETVPNGEGSENLESQLRVTKSELTVATDEKHQLEQKVENLNYLLDKYRNELSQTSEELEHTRLTLAQEGETAQQLNQRVQSMNLVLETTEQNHAEHGRELAQSRRRFDDATAASKREIERLTEDLEEIAEELSKSQTELKQVKRKAIQEIQKLEEETVAVKNETCKQKSKLEAWELELQRRVDEHGKGAKELEHSKLLSNDALVRAEKEVVNLKHEIDVLAKANDSHVDMSAKSESLKDDLKQALLESELEKNQQLKQMQILLEATRSDNEGLSKAIQEAEKRFRISLKTSEDEKSRLKQSLDEVNMQFMSPVGNHSQAAARMIQVEDIRIDPVQEDQLTRSAPTTVAEGAESDENSDCGTEEDSSKIMARIDDMFGEKKKCITWKESEWDIDAPSMSSHATCTSKSASSSVKSVLKPSHYPMVSVEPSELTATEAQMLCLDQSDSDSQESGILPETDAQSDEESDTFADVTTFEEAIRRTKAELSAVSNEISSDEEPHSQRESASESDFSSISTGSLSDTKWLTPLPVVIEDPIKKRIESGEMVNSKKKKVVSWSLADEHSHEHERYTGTLDAGYDGYHVQQIEQTDAASTTIESREPVQMSSESVLNGDSRQITDDSIEEETIDSEIDFSSSEVVEREADDDSTLGWRIQHFGDNRNEKGDSTPEEEARASNWETTRTTAHAPPAIEEDQKGKRDDNNGRHESGQQLSRLAENTIVDTGDEVSSAMTIVETSFHAEAYTSSFSSSFSYSSSDSASNDNKIEIEGREPGNTGGSMFKDEHSVLPVKPPTENHSSTTVLRQKKKSGFQRALDKAARRNWSKQELTRFISSKKVGRFNKIPRSPVAGNQTCDEKSKEERNGSKQAGIQTKLPSQQPHSSIE